VRIGRQSFVLGGESGPHFDNVEASPWGDLECEVERLG
jgi:hypothetical protein